MWLFRRDPKELDKEERERLALLLECAPDLKLAYDLREELIGNFETEHSCTPPSPSTKRRISLLAALSPILMTGP